MPDTAATLTLADVYAQLPTVTCRLLCQDSCRDVPLLTAERDRLGLPDTFDVCPKLSGFGTCTVHEDRPLACRLWAVAENMPCPHGCQPTRSLTVAEASTLVATAEATGRGWVNL